MKRFTRALVLCLSFVLCFSLAAVADSDRYNDLGNKIQCSCGCGQILLKCNHIGCPSSDGMIRQLRAAVQKLPNDEDVLNWFRRSYGMTVVVAPATRGFELTIWLLPPVLAIVGIVLLFAISRNWRSRAVPVGVVSLDPGLEELRSRARKETEI